MIDKKRLISTIKAINSGDVSERYADRDQLAKYFAVNTFVLNADCYTTNMAHNYYLYEHSGQISMVPWDYDMSLGSTMHFQGDAVTYINTAIDTPVIDTAMEERPLLNALMRDTEWKEMYHAELQSFLEKYFYSGYFDSEIERIVQMAEPYVEQEIGDTVLFNTAAESVKKFCAARINSIQGQLNGVIPSTTDGQRENPHLLTDGDGFECSDFDGMLNTIAKEKIELSSVIDVLGSQLNLPVLLTILPLDRILANRETISADSTETLSEQLTSMGITVNEQEMKKVCLKLLLQYAAQLVMPLLALGAFGITFVLVHRSYKNSRPRAVKRKVR